MYSLHLRMEDSGKMGKVENSKLYSQVSETTKGLKCATPVQCS